MKSGVRSDYWVFEWSDAFDPSLADLTSQFPEAILGRRVVIASCDSGPFRPSPSERKDGWTVEGRLAVSPRIERIELLPMPGFDEWYVYDDAVPSGDHLAFVNRWGFSPLDSDCDQSLPFWEQVQRLRPLHVFGAGAPTMFLATRDESLAEKVANV